METIINFIQQYWGVTLFGGVTVGSVIILVLTLVKTYIQNRKNSTAVDAMKATLVAFMGTAKNENSVLSQANKELTERLEASELARVKENKYFQEVQNATFKTLSYLVMASKLSTEDKTTLLESYSALTKKSVEEITEASEEVETKVEAIEEKGIEDTVIEACEHATTLLEKYNKGE